MKKHLPKTVSILLFICFIFLISHAKVADACPQLGAKELKSFKDKTGVDLNQSFTLPLSSQMTAPAQHAAQWDRQQKKKWMILLPTTKINDLKVTDYRIFSCLPSMMAYYPCTKTLYQLRVQLNPAESCNSTQSDKMNVAILVSVENKNLKILDYLFESNPISHQFTPVGLLVLEDIELSKKESLPL